MGYSCDRSCLLLIISTWVYVCQETLLSAVPSFVAICSWTVSRRLMKASLTLDNPQMMCGEVGTPVVWTLLSSTCAAPHRAGQLSPGMLSPGNCYHPTGVRTKVRNSFTLLPWSPLPSYMSCNDWVKPYFLSTKWGPVARSSSRSVFCQYWIYPPLDNEITNYVFRLADGNLIQKAETNVSSLDLC